MEHGHHHEDHHGEHGHNTHHDMNHHNHASPAQSRYNREFLRLISNMDFQFWVIWAAQSSKRKFFNSSNMPLLRAAFSYFYGKYLLI
jgi:hypothetical protein